MKNSWFGIFTFTSIASLFTLFSCVSTENIEPEMPIEKSDELVLNLSAPEALKTRAEEGYFLRYVVKVFPLSLDNSMISKNMRRVEILESPDPTKNKVVFKIGADSTYQIIVFADYIKNAVSDVSTGWYNDCFYNTHYSEPYIQMYTNPADNDTNGSGDLNSISNSFFNNDKYECFFISETIQKTAALKEKELELKRAVAKVEFIDETEKSGTFNSLIISSLKLNRTLYIREKGNASSSNTYNQSQIDTSNITPNEESLFYFYCFANPITVNSEVKIDVKFKTIIKEGEKEKTIEAKNLLVRPNYITKVRGSFLTSLENTQEEIEGDLILDLSTNKTWGDPDLEEFP